VAYAARVKTSSLSEIIVYLDRDAWAAAEDPPTTPGTQPAHFVLTGAPGLTVTGVSVGDKKITLSLSGAVDPHVSLSLAFTTPLQTGDGIHSVQATLPIRIAGVAFSLVLALNRVGQHTYSAGDAVVLDTAGIRISDATAAARTVYQILHPAAGSVPSHSHTAMGSGQAGGGPLAPFYGAVHA
jgi:hypothetical protein